MSLSFFITLSLLSSQAFLSKKLLPSPYEITHLLQKNLLKKSDQKLVNVLLNQDQKQDSFNPGLIYEIIDKNQNYQEIIQDIKTNYQQVSNKELTKKRSKSSSSKKIFESFARWQTSPNFNKPYSLYYFANQYLKDTKLSKDEINSLKNDLSSKNNVLYNEKITNFWQNKNNKEIGNQFVDDNAFSSNHYIQWIDEIIQELENNKLSSDNLEKLRSLKGYEKRKLQNFLQYNYNNEELKKIYHEWINTNTSDAKQQLYSKIKTLDPSSVPQKIFNDKKAWDLIDFLINNKDESLYNKWKKQLSIDQKKMLLKYSKKFFKVEFVRDFIKKNPSFSFDKMLELYIKPNYFNKLSRGWWKSNQADYSSMKLKSFRVNHIDNIWKELIKNKDFFQKLFDKFFDEFRKLKSNKKLIQENWKKSEKYKKEKAEDGEYDNKPKYQTDLDEWINTIKKKPIDGDSSWHPNDMWIFGPFQNFLMKEAYLVKEPWKPWNEYLPFEGAPYKVRLKSNQNWLNYRIELDGLNFFDFIFFGSHHRMVFSNNGGYNRNLLRWILSKKNNPHASMIEFIFDRSQIEEDLSLTVSSFKNHKLEDSRIDEVFQNWVPNKDDDLEIVKFSLELLKTNLNQILKSIINNFANFAKQQNYQIKSNQEYLSEASKQWFIDVIAKWLNNHQQFSNSLPLIIKKAFQDYVTKATVSDNKIQKIYNDWASSFYINKELELDDIKFLLNEDKNQSKDNKEAIKYIKNYFKDFVKNKLVLDNDLKEYLASNFIKDIILLNKDHLEIKRFLTQWYKKAKKAYLNENYQQYLKKA